MTFGELERSVIILFTPLLTCPVAMENAGLCRELVVMILDIHDMYTKLFQKFTYLISVSKYGITVYILDFTHPHFALVKILANQTTVRLL